MRAYPALRPTYRDRLPQGTAWVLSTLRRARSWKTAREVAVKADVSALKALGFCTVFWNSHGGYPALSEERARARATMRVASRLRRLREAGLVLQRIDVEETRTGGLKPVTRWRAAPR